ncbi:MAG: DUF2057 domain-containing protein [Pseudomonadota bacterium]
MAVTLLIPVAVLADVSLRLGDGVRVIAVNGDMATARLEAGADNALEVGNGKTQLVVEYSAEVRGTAGGEFLETSDTHVLLFEAHETSLALKAPDIDSQHEMDDFNRSRQWRLVDHRGRAIEYAIDVLEKKGFQLGRNHGQELAAFNRTDSPAAYSAAAEVAATEVAAKEIAATEESDAAALESVNAADQATAESDDSRSLADQAMIERMLKYWYQQASQVTRNNFKSWIETSH